MYFRVEIEENNVKLTKKTILHKERHVIHSVSKVAYDQIYRFTEYLIFTGFPNKRQNVVVRMWNASIRC